MKVYWSRCGHGHGNFGDKVTPMLLKHAGIAVEWAPPEHAELIGVGSILEKVPDTFRGTIWTTGFMHESSRRAFANARVLALRGKLTRERVTCSTPEAITLGDAGLLCADLAPTVAKKHKLGIIPHFVDIADPFVKALADSSSDVRVIDICAETSEVMRSVAECEHVISSSLHGLILADSLGIPNRWMELNRGDEIVTGAGFKYHDHYSVLDVCPKPLHLNATVTLDEILNATAQVPRVAVEVVQANLRGTLRAIKESVRPLSAEERESRRAAQADWKAKRDAFLKTVIPIIPAASFVIVADDEQVRSSLNGLRTVPFIERDGVYWGPPTTSEEAIATLDRQLSCGASWLVIAWPMFWLTEKYPAFASHVHRHFECISVSETAQIFRSKGAHN